MNFLQKEGAISSSQYFSFFILHSDDHGEGLLQVATKVFQKSLLISKRQ